MNKKSIIFSPNLEYKGQLILRVVDANGRVHKISKHNEGTEELFMFLSMCLCGYDVHRSSPTKLRVMSSGETPVVLIQNIGISDRSYSKDNELGWYSRFRASIPKSIVPSSIVGNVTFELMGGTSGTDTYAQVKDVDGSILSNLLPGMTLSVEWIMQISNPTTSGV